MAESTVAAAGAGAGSPVTDSMVKEEEKLKAGEEEWKPEQDREYQKFHRISTNDKVARLDDLLKKASAYSKFLANKIQYSHEDTMRQMEAEVDGGAKSLSRRFENCKVLDFVLVFRSQFLNHF